MTTDNPDPLEAVIAAFLRAYFKDADEQDKQHHRAVITAIIAQHYAPVIAENERLMKDLAAIPCQTEAVEDMEVGCCSPCRARQALGEKS